MKKGLTEIVFILDRSGSMNGLEKDTIGGFNSFIEKQKQEDGESYVSTVLFSNSSEVLYDRVDLNKIEPMNEKQYVTYGSTALLDAIGDAIHHIKNVHKYARVEDVPEHTIFVITTDGLENASRSYSRLDIKNLIEKQQNDSGWEFMFLGANIDAIATAESYGIPKYMAADYSASEEGTIDAFKAIHENVCCCRMEVPMQDRKWKETIKPKDKKK